VVNGRVLSWFLAKIFEAVRWSVDKSLGFIVPTGLYFMTPRKLDELFVDWIWPVLELIPDEPDRMNGLLSISGEFYWMFKFSLLC